MCPELSLLRRLPAVETVLADPEVAALRPRFGHVLVREAVRRRLEGLRGAIRSGLLDQETLDSQAAAIPAWVQAALEESARSPYRRVINASGIVVHTNLGRAPLSERAAESMLAAARGSLALEYDLDGGSRGSRSGPLRAVLESLFPGSTGLAVTNNAAAVLLALNTLADGMEVIISRGELVEIGGSFRVPDIMTKSGARLVEVGTTNRTRTADYAAAVGPDTAAILRVHPSNFLQIGFTESAPSRDLAALAKQRGVPLIVDQGSGNLQELGPFGIPDEPTVTSVLEEGADLVTFSGDKLLGGPQAGVVVGSPELVARLAGNPLARALRPDKLILAGLLETLKTHQRGRAFEEIPVLRRLATPLEMIADRVEHLAQALRQAGVAPDRIAIESGRSRSGGGSSPRGEIATVLLSLAPGEDGEEALAVRLRQGEPAVIGRLAAARLILDLRSVDAGEDELLADAVARAATSA